MTPLDQTLTIINLILVVAGILFCAYLIYAIKRADKAKRSHKECSDMWCELNKEVKK